MFFAHIPIVNEYVLNKSIWPINETLTNTFTPGPNMPRSNGNKKVRHTSRSSRNGAVTKDTVAIIEIFFLRRGEVLCLSRYLNVALVLWLVDLLTLSLPRLCLKDPQILDDNLSGISSDSLDGSLPGYWRLKDKKPSPLTIKNCFWNTMV